MRTHAVSCGAMSTVKWGPLYVRYLKIETEKITCVYVLYVCCAVLDSTLVKWVFLKIWLPWVFLRQISDEWTDLLWLNYRSSVFSVFLTFQFWNFQNHTRTTVNPRLTHGQPTVNQRPSHGELFFIIYFIVGWPWVDRGLTVGWPWDDRGFVKINNKK